MGRTYSTHEFCEKYIQNFSWKTGKRDLSMDGRVRLILKKQGVLIFIWLREGSGGGLL
jgi:hypothetical protein